MSYKIEKQNLPVFLNEDGEPVAVVFFTKNRERVLFLAKKADEDEIISVYEGRDLKLRNKGLGDLSSTSGTAFVDDLSTT